MAKVVNVYLELPDGAREKVKGFIQEVGKKLGKAYDEGMKAGKAPSSTGKFPERS